MSCTKFLLYLHCRRKTVADIVGSVKLSSVPKSLVNFKVQQVIVARSLLGWNISCVAIIGSHPKYPPRVWAVSYISLQVLPEPSVG